MGESWSGERWGVGGVALARAGSGRHTQSQKGGKGVCGVGGFSRV